MKLKFKRDRNKFVLAYEIGLDEKLKSIWDIVGYFDSVSKAEKQIKTTFENNDHMVWRQYAIMTRTNEIVARYIYTEDAKILVI